MAMPTGTVIMDSFVLIVRANRNSCHASTKTIMAVVNSPGETRGSSTRKKTPSTEAPSTLAASSSSTGICLKNVVRYQMAIGRA
ncbi:hypothetical protein D3C71_2032190 [compost metagenome]